MTPRQLWISGILNHYSSNYAGVRGVVNNTLPDDLRMSGDDPTAPAPDPDNDSVGVDVGSINTNFPSHVITIICPHGTRWKSRNGYLFTSQIISVTLYSVHNMKMSYYA